MNQKTLTLIIVAVLAIAVVAVAAYFIMGTEDNVEDTITVENASSLQFSVDLTLEETSLGSYVYSAKNIGTTDLMVRVEIPDPSGDLIYIVNGADQTAWAYAADEWLDLSETFTNEWDMWSGTMDGYKDSLATWEEGDWTFTDTDGTGVRVYDISIDPALADSLFAP